MDREREYVRRVEGGLGGELARLKEFVEARGVRRPDLGAMVSACLPFEQLSFEKKYCPPINSENLDNIPDDIACFGVDMAAWIAFKADHEALARVVAGVNPEEVGKPALEHNPKQPTQPPHPPTNRTNPPFVPPSPALPPPPFLSLPSHS